MKKQLIIIFSVLLLIVLVSVLQFTQAPANETNTKVPIYVGVAFGGNTVEEAKALIDRTKNNTNLFILQSGPLTENQTATTEICDYAASSGLNLIVYFNDFDPRVLAQKDLTWRTTWVINAKSMYGDHFLGVYYYDERGGIYLDTNKTATGWYLPANATYDTAAYGFEQGFLRDPGTIALKNARIPIFCSDYALYWFDYRSGYDVMLAEVGWNHTLAKDIALVRGAANFQQKDWGVIITWKNTQPPYLDSGDAIYEQMRVSYAAGAKYITIFNYPFNGSAYGIMGDDHFDALERLWNDISQGKITQNPLAEAVLILPKNYGFGMRTSGDTIWGFWGPDEISSVIWDKVQLLLNRYSYSLDIAYDDSSYAIPSNYKTVYYWNSTIT
jgi:hypothetical protein